jgi:hypothetical protein
MKITMEVNTHSKRDTYELLEIRITYLDYG